MTDTVSLGLTGDVMLGRTVDIRQQDRVPASVWGTTLDHLQALDGLLVNLECVLSTRGERWRRTDRPFHFRADPRWAIPTLAAADVDCCALANNHVLDFETVALADTLEHLDDAGIARSGAGRTLDEALEPASFSVDGLDVAVVSFTDNTPEFAAGPNSPGVAHVSMDVDDATCVDRVTEALARARDRRPDLLVASLHAGPNMVEEPSERHRRFAHWLAAAGVDLVHGHSAHVFQGVEVHDGTLILHDCGDFVDDYRVDSRLRNDRSFLFEVSLTDGDLRHLRLRPTEIRDCRVHLAGRRAGEWARERMQQLSASFGTEFERDGDRLVLSL